MIPAELRILEEALMAKTDLEYRNFVPPPHDDIAARSILIHVEELAPYEALSSGTVERTGTEFRAYLEVRTSSTTLESYGTGGSLDQALKQAEIRLLEKLAMWRRDRFQPLEGKGGLKVAA